MTGSPILASYTASGASFAPSSNSVSHFGQTPTSSGLNDRGAWSLAPHLGHPITMAFARRKRKWTPHAAHVTLVEGATTPKDQLRHAGHFPFSCSHLRTSGESTIWLVASATLAAMTAHAENAAQAGNAVLTATKARKPTTHVTAMAQKT